MKFSSLALILFLGLSLVSSSCNKTPEPKPPKEEELPALTHQGLNTFGCRVNGKVWVAGVPFSVGGPITVNTTYHYNGDGLFILTGTREKKDLGIFEDIIIRGDSILELDVYNMRIADDNEAGLKDWTHNNYNCGRYVHDMDNPGMINITFLDTINRIISGTFEMDLINHPSCESETLKITEGRFDLLY